MCGISGIISEYSSDKVEEQLIKMTDIIRHRGPDGFGFYHKDTIYLGHRRLSILDVSSAGTQPMSYRDRYTITYNGEVYNYIEIKDTLAEFGYIFNSHCDTEVILAAYDHWGVECVNYFNGMWAFAIHDTYKNIIFCSRDRFGVKPFYYTTNTEHNFIFGSEIKQLLTFFERPVVNIPILLAYLVQNITNHTNQTFFENIFELRGGHNLIYNIATHDFSITSFYEIHTDKALLELSEVDAIKLFREQFERSVKWRLRSDVKVGTCLSGGLDSSSIAGFANALHQQVTNDPFCSITAKSSLKQDDESSYAILVGEHLGLKQYFVEPTKDDFINNIKELVYTQEEPFVGPTVFMQYFVMKTARENGITVLLDGQGADESLLGYSRYFSLVFKNIADLFKLKKNNDISILDIFKNKLYFTQTRLRKFIQLRRVSGLKKYYQKSIDWSIISLIADSYSDIQNLQKLELTKTQVPQLLRFEDKNSMRHSIETRLPFLDWQLVELNLSLHLNLKLKNGWSKYILRKASEHLIPPEIAWRTNKKNFNAPVSEWLNQKPFFFEVITQSGILKELFEVIPSEKNIKDDIFLWRLFNIAVWESVYNVGIEKVQK